MRVAAPHADPNFYSNDGDMGYANTVLFRIWEMCFLTLKKPAVACGQIAVSQSRWCSQKVMPRSARMGSAQFNQSRSGPRVTNGVKICLAPTSCAHSTRITGWVALRRIGLKFRRVAASANAAVSNASTASATGRSARRWLQDRVAVLQRSRPDKSTPSI